MIRWLQCKFHNARGVLRSSLIQTISFPTSVQIQAAIRSFSDLGIPEDKPDLRPAIENKSLKKASAAAARHARCDPDLINDRYHLRPRIFFQDAPPQVPRTFSFRSCRYRTNGTASSRIGAASHKGSPECRSWRSRSVCSDCIEPCGSRHSPDWLVADSRSCRGRRSWDWPRCHCSSRLSWWVGTRRGCICR